MTIVPAHQAAGVIGACLDGLINTGFAVGDILVVDDGSSDGTGDIARELGVTVLRHDTPLGPAMARNAGVEAVSADIVLFVDADVVVSRDIRNRVLEHFQPDPKLKALFGSYDDQPPLNGAVSIYRNFLHHFVHQASHQEAATFWTGIGAVRREDFVRLGGLDRKWQNIEDVAFGVFLRAEGGRILLDKNLLGKHLKTWSLGSMFKTDLVGRAIPWSRLILFHGGPSNDLNFTRSHRFSLIMVILMGLSLPLMPFQPFAFVVLALALIGFYGFNRRFLTLLRQRFGIGIATKAFGCHILHYLAGGLGLSWVLLMEYLPWRLGPGRFNSAADVPGGDPAKRPVRSRLR